MIPSPVNLSTVPPKRCTTTVARLTSSAMISVADFFGGDEAKLQDYLKFRDTLTGLENPTRISDVIASGLDQYDAVFVPGGHGPMMDLLDDPDAGTVMRHFHETSKPTAVLCHGPISLLSASPNSKEVVTALAAPLLTTTSALP